MTTDQFFQDESDDPDETTDGSRPTKKKSQAAKKAPARVSQYFAHVKHDKTNVNRTEVVTDAMKNEWWYDMFDVERAKFDVRDEEKSDDDRNEVSLSVVCRSNYRANSNCFEEFFKNAKRSEINY